MNNYKHIVDNKVVWEGLEEEQVIYENDDQIFRVDNYLYGSCHLFALELAKITGLEVGVFIEDLMESESENFYLQHAFCLHPTDESKAIDCRGVVDRKFLFDEYCGDCLNPIEIGNAEQFLKEGIQEGRYHDWEEDMLLTDPHVNLIFENEQKIIHDFIKDNIKKGVFPEKPKTKNRLRLK